MKRSSLHAFTLVEMLTVMAVIAVLTGMVVATNGYVQNKAARERARGEIQELSQACESYKTDYAQYPQNDDTDELDPKADFNPTSGKTGDKYRKACRTLYCAVSGDFLPDNEPDGQPEDPKRAYINFQPNRLNVKKDESGRVKEVRFLQDPFGNCYGYSTMGLAEEQKYRKDVKKDPRTARPETSRGFNPNFDMWSTTGQTTQAGAAKWEKNWSN